MSDRFPLILNTSTNQIQEIASGDTLDLTGNNIKGVGIITATTISGTLSGIATLARGLTDIPSINVTNITGVGATFSKDLDVDGHTNLDNVSISGVVTATSFKGDGDFVELDVDGHTNLDNVSVAGVSTFSGNILPGTDSSHNLGSNGVRFANIYGDALYGVIQNSTHTNITRVGTLGQLTVSGTANPLNVTHTSANCVNLNRGGKSIGIDVNQGGSNTHSLISLTTGMDLRFKLGGTDKIVFKSAGHIEPITDSQINLGSNSVRFANVYADNFHANGDLDVDGHTNLDNVSIAGVSTFTGAINGSSAAFTGNVSVGGVLTYEDVTNVDSVGIVTARTGLKVLAGGANVVGVSIFSDDVKVGSGVTITPAGAGFFAGIVTASSFVQRDGSPVGGVVSDSDGNTTAGSNAGANFTSGQALNNTLFGLNAGNDITTGDLNVAVGKDTLDACNTGRFNTAVGGSALGGIQGGSENTAVGYQAGLAAGSGNMTKNVFMGYSAGQSITSDENTVIGYEAGKANNTSGKLVAYGYEAATNSQNSGRLTAIGYRAGKAHTGGNGNTYLGYEAGYLNGNGDRNVVIGDLAVSGSSDFNRVTVIGGGAAGGFGSNANDNTVVGYNAGSSTLTGTNNVIIGSGANLSGNVSNEITLGNASITRFRIPGIGVDLTGPIGITTEQVTPASNVATLNLAKDDHKIVASGTYTIDVNGGTEAGSHTLRIENSGTANVGFSTYFKFPSGGTPSLPTASGAISLISFSVHKVGSVGIATVLLAGASVNFS